MILLILLMLIVFLVIVFLSFHFLSHNRRFYDRKLVKKNIPKECVGACRYPSGNQLIPFGIKSEYSKCPYQAINEDGNCVWNGK